MHSIESDAVPKTTSTEPDSGSVSSQPVGQLPVDYRFLVVSEDSQMVRSGVTQGNCVIYM